MTTRNPAHYRDVLNHILNESSIPIPNKQELNLARFTRLARQLNVPSWIANFEFDNVQLHDDTERLYYMTIKKLNISFIQIMHTDIFVYPDDISGSGIFHTSLKIPKNLSSKETNDFVTKVCSTWGLNQLRINTSRIVGYDTGPWKFHESVDDEVMFGNTNLPDMICQYLKPFAPLFFYQPNDIKKWQSSLKV